MNYGTSSADCLSDQEIWLHVHCLKRALHVQKASARF